MTQRAPTPHLRTAARRRALEALHAADVNDADALLALEPGDETYARALVTGVIEHREELDELISARAEHWSLERMPVVDRNLLRLGVFELLYQPDVPAGVVIDEAVRLARLLSTEDSGRFVNGLLARVARDRKA